MGATSTYKSFLMHKPSSEWEKLVDISSYPDLGGTPEMLDATTLSDPVIVNIMGIQSLDALEFECNYDLEKYTELKEMEGVGKDFAVWLGAKVTGGELVPDGTDGKFEFKGQMAVRLNGGGVNEVRKMTVTIVPSTPIVLGT